MLRLLADENAEKYLDAVLSVCRSPRWVGIWAALDVRVVTFADLSLVGSAPDDAIWFACQREGVVLFTDNRNSDTLDSLQATILAQNTVSSLPVLTPGESPRLLTDQDYLERAAIRLMEILMEIDQYRGTGRLFIPLGP
jgi:hypothetical protein